MYVCAEAAKKLDFMLMNTPAVLYQVSGSPRDFPKTKEEYVNWGDEDEDGDRGARFRGKPLEPFTKPLA
jgi:hypothetical protein